MEFDQLHVIWNAQQNEPLFAINERAMHNLIRCKSARIDRLVSWCELAVIALTLLIAVLLPLDAWREGDGWHAYAVALICLATAIWTLLARWQRHLQVATYEQSVKGIAERALAQLDRHMQRLRLYFWGFHVPIALAAAIGLTAYSNKRPLLIWAGVLVVTAFVYWATHYDIHGRLIPRCRELQQLLAKLTEAEETRPETPIPSKPDA
jgi:hypothetical protein